MLLHCGGSHSMNEPREIPSYEIDLSRMVFYNTNWRPHQDAVESFDLLLAKTHEANFLGRRFLMPLYLAFRSPAD